MIALSPLVSKSCGRSHICFDLLTFPLALDCPDGWKTSESSCYKVVGTFGNSQTFGWLKALRVCSGFGGNLVSITSEKEKEFVYNLFSSTIGNNSAWVGLMYNSQLGRYQWIDGSSFHNFLFINLLGSTTSSEKENKCVELSRKGWKLTECCKENQYYICERPKGELCLCHYCLALLAISELRWEVGEFQI